MSRPSQTVIAIAPNGESVGLSAMTVDRTVWLGVRNSRVALLDAATAGKAEGDPRTVDPAELRAMSKALDRFAARLVERTG